MSQGYLLYRGLEVFGMYQYFVGQLSVFVDRLNIPAPVVVANDLAIALKHQLGNPAAVDSELGAFVVLLEPVMEDAAVNP